jgi:hypothetical protein
VGDAAPPEGSRDKWICILSMFVVFAEIVGGYHPHRLDYFLLECLNDGLLVVFLMNQRLPTDVLIQEGLEHRQHVVLNNRKDIHLHRALLLGEVVNAFSGGEHHHLHPKALQTVAVAGFDVVVEDG